MTIRAAIPALAATLALVAACAVPPSGGGVKPQIVGSNRPYDNFAACSSNFAAYKAQLLAAGTFDFKLNGMTSLDNSAIFRQPKADPTYPVSQIDANALNAAFAQAPPSLQTALCENVDVVYVDQDSQAPLGWAYWEEKLLGQSGTADPNTPAVGSGHGVYIAVNKVVLDNAQTSTFTPPATMSKLEKLALRTLLSTGFGTVVKDVSVKDSNGMDTPADAVMLILAREMGFVIEHELAVGSVTPTNATCKGTFSLSNFYNLSWKGYDPTQLQPEFGRIHKLGDRTWGPATASDLPSNLPSLTKISKDIADDNTQNTYKAVADMKQIYGSSTNTGPFMPEWADLLASQAPIEDFVETYRLVALSTVTLGVTTPMTSMVVNFADGSPSYDIIQTNLNHAGSTLQTKANCIRSLGTLPGLPSQ